MKEQAPANEIMANPVYSLTTSPVFARMRSRISPDKRPSVTQWRFIPEKSGGLNWSMQHHLI
jgi:hypothetical protein